MTVLSAFLSYTLVIAVLIYLINEAYKFFTMKKLKGELALITGGAGGLGRLLASKLMSEGASVIIVDINKESIEDAVKELNKNAKDTRAYGFVCDITNHEKVYEIAKTVQKDIGEVTILINNAGMYSGKKIFDSEEATMRKTLEVNTISHFWTIKAFLPKMIEKNHGYLVTVSSMAGIVGTPGMTDYTSSKFACFALNESLRMELRVLGKSNIQVLAVCPYFMKTPMFQYAVSRWPWLFPILDPDDVAERTVLSMKRGDGLLVLPAFGYVTFLVRLILPIWAQDSLAFLCGAAENYFVKQKKD